ncbi:hypothetical protein CO652_25710 [Rhizobium sp. H4]|uniref:hypothetical protein n=1 Tax=Rhizobium TaxID=379 RepID=UPI000BE9F0BE|nr:MULTISPECIES: hypothetical protein [Rhizobium]PDV85650.1 hypothetical protein CO652_25710 [Rhizobium sp. H4]WET73210.1 hypothetical protein PYR68_17450 [Rhizobium croatiense]
MTMGSLETDCYTDIDSNLNFYCQIILLLPACSLILRPILYQGIDFVRPTDAWPQAGRLPASRAIEGQRLDRNWRASTNHFEALETERKTLSA